MATSDTATANSDAHIGMLDGWRALSILAVLAGHWFPIGPQRWQFNAMIATSGMAIFFALSGFLICRLLIIDPRPRSFLIRRIARVVPLAWLAMAILAIANAASWQIATANFFFVSNLPPARLMAGGEHLWSLCVEVQFYLAAALLVAIAGRKGLVILPVLAILVTIARILAHQPISIITWHRVDEILAGTAAALIAARIQGYTTDRRIYNLVPVVLIALLLLSSHPSTGPLRYLRPYFSAGAVLSSLYFAPSVMRKLWLSSAASYIAKTSYAVYVFHGMLTHTWLGGLNASRAAIYIRRPLLVLATFGLAHLSTTYYESRWIKWGKTFLAPHR